MLLRKEEKRRVESISVHTLFCNSADATTHVYPGVPLASLDYGPSQISHLPIPLLEEVDFESSPVANVMREGG